MLNNIVDNLEQCGQQNIVQCCFHQARTGCSFFAVYRKLCGEPQHFRRQRLTTTRLILHRTVLLWIHDRNESMHRINSANTNILSPKIFVSIILLGLLGLIQSQ